jgi:hypothetical protein
MTVPRAAARWLLLMRCQLLSWTSCLSCGLKSSPPPPFCSMLVAMPCLLCAEQCFSDENAKT